MDVGNSVIVVEYDMDVVVYVDWIIDFGFGVGDEGGCIVVLGLFDCFVKVSGKIGSKIVFYLVW